MGEFRWPRLPPQLEIMNRRPWEGRLVHMEIGARKKNRHRCRLDRPLGSLPEEQLLQHSSRASLDDGTTLGHSRQQSIAVTPPNEVQTLDCAGASQGHDNQVERTTQRSSNGKKVIEHRSRTGPAWRHEDGNMNILVQFIITL